MKHVLNFTGGGLLGLLAGKAIGHGVSPLTVFGLLIPGMLLLSIGAQLGARDLFQK